MEEFNRMPRIQEPLPDNQVKIPAPPAVNPPSARPWFLMALPIIGLFVMVGVYGGLRGDWTLAIPMVAMSGFSTMASILATVVQKRNYEQKLEEDEIAYTDALAQKQDELEALRLEQQHIRIDVDPNLKAVVTRARDRHFRLWERRSKDGDFLTMRLGLGDMPSSVEVSAPHPDMPDPRLQRAHALEAEYAKVPDVPVLVNLRAGPLGIAGPLSERTGVARALICNLVVHHAYDQVQLLAIYSYDQRAEWEWLKWLPHTGRLGSPVGWHYLANDSISAQDVLKDLLEQLHQRQNQLYAIQPGEDMPAWPWLVLLVEDYEQVCDHPAIHLLLSAEGRKLNATAIFLLDEAHQVPMDCHGVVECRSDGESVYSIAGPEGAIFECRSELADAALCEQLARDLAPLEVLALQSDSALPSNVRLLDLVEIKDIEEYDFAGNWNSKLTKDYLKFEYLKVIIGARRGDQPMILDLNHTGHGPHGLIAGTTGSGKSELVQTLVVALALKHHPYNVGFVLVDFKGGGTFSELVHLPHTLGMVTDLSGNLTERAKVALDAEIDRRKRLFNEAGVNDIGPYQQAYWEGKVREPLPRLVIIIDEFAELVSDYPDFMDGLIAIARVGRSLGVHLILATQSPGGVVKQQIWANAKFRICLRVESRQESQEMLHRPEAADLPRMPGRGYLQVGNNDVFELFQVARVAGRYHKMAGPQRKVGDTGPLGQKKDVVIAEITSLGQRKELYDSGKLKKKEEDTRPELPTDIDVVVARLAALAEQMDIEKLPSPWPDPLPEHVTLPDLLKQKDYAGWDGTNWVFDSTRADSLTSVSPPPPRPPDCKNRPWLESLLGLQDDPAHQRQFPLFIKLYEQDGHLLVISAPGSGREMWIRTLITSLARTHAPDELHFYLLEFGGGALQVFEQLPHVGGILTPLDEERVPRLFRFLLDELDKRKDLCNRAGADGLIRLRSSQPDQAPAAIVIIITGFVEFRTMFQEEMGQLARLIREGGPYGIHAVLMGDRAGDVPMAINSVIARRVVLRLADADEYSMILGARLKVSQDGMPLGRGWYGRPPLEFQTASPGEEKDENEQIAELQDLATQMKRAVDGNGAAWKAKLPKPVLELPQSIPLAELLSDVSSQAVLPLRVPIGLDYLRTQPVFVDLVSDGPDFMISSTLQGGKTSLLLTWTLALARLNSPQQVQFVLVAGKRDSLRPLRGLPHILDYCRTGENFYSDGPLTRLQAEVQRRERLLSDASVQSNEMPHIVVMIDDYDEFYYAVGERREVQTELEKLVKQGRNVDLHTIVTGPLPDMGGIALRDALIKQLKIGRSGFILRILDAADQNPLGLRLRLKMTQQMPPGRGYVVRNGFEEMLQVALPGEPQEIESKVVEIDQYWREAGASLARWPDVVREQAEEKAAVA